MDNGGGQPKDHVIDVQKELERFQDKMNLVLKFSQLLMSNGPSNSSTTGTNTFEVSTVTNIGGANPGKKESSIMSVITAARAARIAVIMARKIIPVVVRTPSRGAGRTGEISQVEIQD